MQVKSHGPCNGWEIINHVFFFMPEMCDAVITPLICKILCTHKFSMNFDLNVKLCKECGAVGVNII